jgi:hypothetical protein
MLNVCQTTSRHACSKKTHACHHVGLDDQSNDPQQFVVIEKVTCVPIYLEQLREEREVSFALKEDTACLRDKASRQR